MNSFTHSIWHTYLFIIITGLNKSVEDGTTSAIKQSYWAKKGSDSPHPLSDHITSVFKQIIKKLIQKCGYYKQLFLKKKVFNTPHSIFILSEIYARKKRLFLKINKFRALYIWMIRVQFCWNELSRSGEEVENVKKDYKGADGRPTKY